MIDFARLIAALQAERGRIDAAIEALEGLQQGLGAAGAGRNGKSRRNGKQPAPEVPELESESETRD